uniref:IRG-type G domain-containing protein n=1 Tax=Dicentrarchus labrax TaxID=13489 RepID=A0A8P4FV31_DICLA
FASVWKNLNVELPLCINHTSTIEYLDKKNNTPLNIAITGETGSELPPTGSVETTMKVAPYPHPNYPNVTLWDLPGVGTTKFPADKYLEHKLAFIHRTTSGAVWGSVSCSRILQHVAPGKGIEPTTFRSRNDPLFFLVSSFELHLYDFHLLEETLERELPAHKRNALLLAMLNINLEIINKKKEALQAKIKYHASVSALIASAPVAGLSFATDVTILAETIRMYQVTFGLDCESLENLARTARVPLNDLKEVMTSPLAAKEISKDLVIKLLCLSAGEAALMAAEEGSRFIPLIGIPLAMTFSFISTYRALSTFLNMLAEDAHRVFTKALGLNTSL